MSRTRALPVAYAPGIDVRGQLRTALRPHVPPEKLECVLSDVLAVAVGVAEARHRDGYRAGSQAGERRARLEDQAVQP